MGEASKSMSSSISIHSIEQAIHYYIKSLSEDVSSSGWRQFNWIWEELPWYTKLLAITGFLSFESTLNKFILPVLFKASISTLERFQKGDWRRQEEEKLKALYSFFHERLQLLTPFMPNESIKEFLALSISSKSFPSFICERDSWKELFSNLSAASQLKSKAILLWHRHETLSQYRLRLKSFYEASHDDMSEKKVIKRDAGHSANVNMRQQFTREGVEDKGLKAQQCSRELERLEEAIDSALQGIKKRIERISHKLNTFKEKVKSRYIFQAVLLRHEDYELYSYSEALYEESLTLLLELEEIQEKLVELVSRRIDTVERGEEVYVRLQEIDVSLDAFEKRREELETKGDAFESHVTTLSSRVEGSIFRLFKRIDAIPLLSLSNPIRQQQMKLVKMAREKLKLYRSLALKPPGPHISFTSLEREIGAVIELAKSFYEEGKEIEEMRSRLKVLSSEIEKIMREEAGREEFVDRTSKDTIPSLENILTKISLLDKNIEMLADRHEQFERIVEELSFFEKRREKKIS